MACKTQELQHQGGHLACPLPSLPLPQCCPGAGTMPGCVRVTVLGCSELRHRVCLS